jgi:hypothetical protein
MAHSSSAVCKTMARFCLRLSQVVGITDRRRSHAACNTPSPPPGRFSPHHLRRLSEGAQESAVHTVAVGKTRLLSDGFRAASTRRFSTASAGDWPVSAWRWRIGEMPIRRHIGRRGGHRLGHTRGVSSPAEHTAADTSDTGADSLQGRGFGPRVVRGSPGASVRTSRRQSSGRSWRGSRANAGRRPSLTLAKHLAPPTAGEIAARTKDGA